MSRQKSALVAQRNDGLVQRIRALKAEHPFWGDRRICASLPFVEPWPVNKKRMLRLMREHQLLVTPNLRLRAKRTLTGKKPRPTKPNEWWGIDMTKVLVQGVGRSGSRITTRMICTQPWATSHPGSLNETTTSAMGLSCRPLDKWGALQAILASSASKVSLLRTSLPG